MERELAQTGWVRAIVPAIGFAGLGVFALLYAFRTDWYFAGLKLFFDNPFHYPFSDFRATLSFVECWRRGIDVYAANPCDELNRPALYSPLVLRLTFLPTSEVSVNLLGGALSAAFLVSLAWLPVPRSARDLLLIVLGTYSSLAVFAMERCNLDLLIFVLAVVAGVSLEHPFPRRMIGYAATMVSGLLKFYPFVLLLLLLRERFARFLVLTLVALAVLAAFVWYYHDELVRAVANLPPPHYFEDNFGARQLPNGLNTKVGNLLDTLGWGGERLRTLLQDPNVIAGELLLLVVAAMLAAWRLAATARFRTALSRLTAREMNFLVIGAALIAGCFFAGQSIGYRGVHLLFALPGVLMLAQAEEWGTLRALFRWCGYAILFNLWWLTLVRLGDEVGRLLPGQNAARTTGAALWFVHEAAWWLVVTVFLAVLFHFIRESATWKATIGAFPLLGVGPRRPSRQQPP